MNGSDKKKKKPARLTELSGAEAGREHGRVSSDPRFTESERRASARIAQKEIAESAKRQKEARRRARRY